jgi:hypothetical protein
MTDGNERQKPKISQQSAYTMHPYYYQQYYLAQQMANGGFIPVMTANGQYAYHPMYAAAYQTGVPMVQGAQSNPGTGFYFPYSHPAYAQYQQHMGYQHTVGSSEANGTSTKQSPTDSVDGASTMIDSPMLPAQDITSGTVEEIPTPESIQQVALSRTVSQHHDTPKHSRTSTIQRTNSMEDMDPLPLSRKVSKTFSVDKSRWRLSRSGSKPSLAIDGTGGDENEDWDLPASPLMGRKPSLSVSPRHCGSEFLSDKEELPEQAKEPMRNFMKTEIHLCDAVKMFAKEVEMPIDSKFAERLERLENAASIKMSVFTEAPVGEVIGLENPVNSKICYLNSVIQILVPISPLSQVLSLSLSHGSAGPWTTALARAMRLFFRPPMGIVPSLLHVGGMDLVLKELGGVGTQQDVAEALGIVLNKLHEEWKHRLRSQPWKGRKEKATAGLDEDSIIYKIFRGVRAMGRNLELFTQLHLAPPGSSGNSLMDLLSQTFHAELHHLPPVLCIELSRHLSENQLTTSQTAVSFSGTLQIPDSCCTTECNQRERTYELVGAVVRSGVYANSGHFWAAQRRGGRWFWINDTEVSECDITEVDQSDRSSGLISKKLDAASSWCVLVYADTKARVAIHPYN